jgi:hypothetical protein
LGSWPLPPSRQRNSTSRPCARPCSRCAGNGARRRIYHVGSWCFDRRGARIHGRRRAAAARGDSRRRRRLDARPQAEERAVERARKTARRGGASRKPSLASRSALGVIATRLSPGWICLGTPIFRAPRCSSSCDCQACATAQLPDNQLCEWVHIRLQRHDHSDERRKHNAVPEYVAQDVAFVPEPVCRG